MEQQQQDFAKMLQDQLTRAGEAKVRIQHNDGYQLVVEEAPSVAVAEFRHLEGLMATQGLAIQGDMRKPTDKWLKQKDKVLLAIETIIHKDPKCVALVSRRANGTYWVHDIIPLLIVSEQPFRKIMKECILDLALDKGIKVIFSKHLDQMEETESSHGISMDEAQRAFDLANDALDAGEKTVTISESEVKNAE